MIINMNRGPVVGIMIMMLFAKATAFPSKVGCGLIGDSGKNVMTRTTVMGATPIDVSNLISFSSNTYSSGGQQITVTISNLETGSSSGALIHSDKGSLSKPSSFDDKGCSGTNTLYYKTSGNNLGSYTLILTVPSDISNVDSITVSVITAPGYGEIRRQAKSLAKSGASPSSSGSSVSPSPSSQSSGGVPSPESSEPENTAGFNPHERQFSVEWRVKNYTLPKIETNYVDFVFNFNDVSQNIFHIVFGEALVDVEWGLHHFVVTGCSQQIEASKEGLPLAGTPEYCNLQIGGFAGWAPGATLWDMPLSAGVPIGAGVGIVAVYINVH